MSLPESTLAKPVGEAIPVDLLREASKAMAALDSRLASWLVAWSRLDGEDQVRELPDLIQRMAIHAKDKRFLQHCYE